MAATKSLLVYKDRAWPCKCCDEGKPSTPPWEAVAMQAIFCSCGYPLHRDLADVIASIDCKTSVLSVQAAYPELTVNGWAFGHPGEPYTAPKEGEEHEKLRAEMTHANSLDQFARALDFIARCEQLKNVNKWAGSYGLKHEAERFLGYGQPKRGNRYVSNGMFIAAVIAAGLKIKRVKDTPNCLMNLSTKGLTT